MHRCSFRLGFSHICCINHNITHHNTGQYSSLISTQHMPCFQYSTNTFLNYSTNTNEDWKLKNHKKCIESQLLVYSEHIHPFSEHLVLVWFKPDHTCHHLSIRRSLLARRCCLSCLYSLWQELAPLARTSTTPQKSVLRPGLPRSPATECALAEPALQ